MNILCALLCLALLPLPALSAAAASPRQETMRGPLAAEVLNVLDGDTVAARVRVWIGQEIETSVRIAGIDAPEIKGKCGKERRLAAAAREEVARLLGGGPVSLYDVRLEKYAGRVMARVESADGTDIGRHMLEKGLARPYGGEKRKPWCGGS